jgi:hypothetical protein
VTRQQAEGERTSHDRGVVRIAASLVQAVTLSPFHLVTLSPCHLVTLSSLLAGALFISGCAGYRVGNQSLYPSDVKTVYVPVFESDSFRRYLGERLTEAVIKEIELKTPYKVTGDSMADSLLSGRISRERKHLLVLNKYHDPRDEEVDLQVQVRWLDRQSNLMREGAPIPVPAELATIGENGTLVPEVGQSVATAQQQAIHRLAVQIVSMMEAPW